jgi:hypothetical protein
MGLPAMNNTARPEPVNLGGCEMQGPETFEERRSR